MNISGQCLCGQIKWTTIENPSFSGFCYCSHCRRMSGSGRSPFLGFDAKTVKITGDTMFYSDTSDQGAGIERHFCPNCGTRMFSVPGSMPSYRIFYAGSLDAPEIFEPQFNIHSASIVDWEYLQDDLETFVGDAPD